MQLFQGTARHFDDLEMVKERYAEEMHQEFNRRCSLQAPANMRKLRVLMMGATFVVEQTQHQTTQHESSPTHDVRGVGARQDFVD